MDANEFAARCNVTPQVVRLWIRQGKIVKRGDGLVLADGYHLLPKTVIRKGECGVGEAAQVGGVSPRTVANWLRSGKLVKAGGELLVADGMRLELSYRIGRK